MQYRPQDPWLTSVTIEECSLLIQEMSPEWRLKIKDHALFYKMPYQTSPNQERMQDPEFYFDGFRC